MTFYGSVFFLPWPSHVPTHVAAPTSSSINSKRLTTTPIQESFVSMCACTEPAATGIGTVCVERGGQTGPKKMLNHAHTEKQKPRRPTPVRSVMKRLFFLGKTRKKGIELRARAPHFIYRAPDTPEHRRATRTGDEYTQSLYSRVSGYFVEVLRQV